MAHFHKTNEEIEQEAALIEKAKINLQEFEVLYNRYFDDIYYFVYHRVSGNDIASDITSQVFMKAMHYLKKFKHKGVPFSAWLYRIASNEVNQYYRKTKKHITISIEESGLKNLLSEFDSARVNEDREMLMKALAELPEDAVNMMQMRFFENRPFAEIAGIVGITENNAKVKVYRILDKLKKIMDKLE